MSDVRLKLAPPWITYVNKLTALFGNDPEIKIVYDNDTCSVRLYVDNAKKASALIRVLPVEKIIGNVILDIEVIPANADDVIGALPNQISNKALFDVMFENNPVYAYSKEIIGVFNNPLTYVVFKNRVVQFFNDNLNDIHGLISTLYQDIATEIFEEADLRSVFYNTDIEERVFNMPLGEWP